MAGKINTFNLGALGVNLNNSPLHVPDGAWRTLQNGEFGDNESAGGVKKRGSLNKINSTALAGAVQALTNVPFPLETAKYLVAAMAVAEGETFKKSADGATYTDVLEATAPRVAQSPTAGILATTVEPRMATFGRNLFYAGNDYIPYPNVNYTQPPICMYNGVAGFEVFRIPNNPDAGFPTVWVTDMFVANGLVYICTFDPYDAVYPRGRVLSYDPTNGVLQEVGSRFDDATLGQPYCIAWFQGRLFVGILSVSGSTVGRFYSIDPNSETTWVQHTTGIAYNGYCRSLVVFQGKLYALMDCNAVGETSCVLSYDGSAWATALDTAVTLSLFQGAVVYNDVLYVGWDKDDASEPKIRRFDGTSWGVELDIGTAYTDRRPTPCPFIFEDELYWVCRNAGSIASQTGFILKRDAMGVWTQALTGIAPFGGLGQVTPDAT